MVTNGHNIAISVKLPRFTTKGRWLTWIRAFCIHLQDSMHGNPSIIGTQEKRNRDNNLKSNNSYCQCKNTDKQFVTLKWMLLIHPINATIAPYASYLTEPGWDLNLNLWLILIGFIPQHKGSQTRIYMFSLSNLCSTFFSSHALKGCNDLSA